MANIVLRLGCPSLTLLLVFSRVVSDIGCASSKRCGLEVLFKTKKPHNSPLERIVRLQISTKSLALVENLNSAPILGGAGVVARDSCCEKRTLS